MTTRPPSRRTPEPPNLRTDLAERADVKALLGELKEGRPSGEDPLFYELPREAPDPACVGADAARVYVAPIEPGMAPRGTMDAASVRLGAAIDPRRAVTERVPTRTRAAAIPAGPESRGGRRGAWIGAVALGLVAGGIAVMVLRGTPKRGPAEAALPASPVQSARAAPEMVPSESMPSPAVSASAPRTVSPAPTVSAPPTPVDFTRRPWSKKKAEPAEPGATVDQAPELNE